MLPPSLPVDELATRAVDQLVRGPEPLPAHAVVDALAFGVHELHPVLGLLQRVRLGQVHGDDDGRRGNLHVGQTRKNCVVSMSFIDNIRDMGKISSESILACVYRSM